MGLDMYLSTNSKRCKRDAERCLDDFERNWRRKSNVALYWRKANAIHKWFVDNVQNGEDDCGTYEVSVEQLEELRETCAKVIAASKLVDGKVWNGRQFKGGEWSDVYDDGKVIEDATVADELLPTTDGFFFGGQQYNEWYLDDVRYTYDAIGALLEHVVKDPEDDLGWSYIHEEEPDWWVEFQYHSSW